MLWLKMKYSARCLIYTVSFGDNCAYTFVNISYEWIHRWSREIYWPGEGDMKGCFGCSRGWSITGSGYCLDSSDVSLFVSIGSIGIWGTITIGEILSSSSQFEFVVSSADAQSSSSRLAQ